MYSHNELSELQRKFSFASQNSLSTQRARRVLPIPSYAIDTTMDGDIDSPIAISHSKSPPQTATRSAGKRVPKRRRSSTLTWDPPSETSSTHITSPYLPSFKLYPPYHPKAAWDPRKRLSVSSVESLEFLRHYGTKRRKIKFGETLGKPRVSVQPSHLSGNEGHDDNSASPFRLYFLLRRASMENDPTYIEPSSVTTMRPKKRRRIADPSYRDVKDLLEADDEFLPPVEKGSQKRKRKRTQDRTYRQSRSTDDISHEVDFERSSIKKRKPTAKSVQRAGPRQVPIVIDDSYHTSEQVLVSMVAVEPMLVSGEHSNSPFDMDVGSQVHVESDLTAEITRRGSNFPHSEKTLIADSDRECEGPLLDRGSDRWCIVM